MSDNSEDNGYQFATRAIRTGHMRTGEQEHAEPIFATSSFVFASAAEAAAVFAGEQDGNIYSRFTNPTVRAFEQRIAALEQGERAVATASGMAAILAACMSVLKAGDHLLASRSIFGTTVVLFEKYLQNWGIEVSFVDLPEVETWQQAMQPNTRALFLETPSNPLLELADIHALAALAHSHDAVLIVDNVLCSPALQQPLTLGADLVVHSATKYLDGQGRVIAGVVVGEQTLMEEVYSFVRSAGPALSPFNAWVVLKGLETLALRMQAHSTSAMALAAWLESLPMVEQVYYPGLETHPQHALAAQQQQGFGGIVSFAVSGGKQAAWQVLDKMEMACISANIGDSKTIVTHPATTTHGRLSDAQRAATGISDGLIRVSVGLEALEDIQKDLAKGLGV